MVNTICLEHRLPKKIEYVNIIVLKMKINVMILLG